MEHPTEQSIIDRENEIRIKRLEALVGSWRLLQDKFVALREGARLNDSLAAEVVENYIRDRGALVARYNIKSRIQRHKIAGLMAANIMKLRPVQLIDDSGDTSRLSRHNELLAAYHGLAVCAEGGERAEIENLIKNRSYSTWFEDVVCFLLRRPDSAEALSLVFETLSLSYFPRNLQRRN